MNKKSTIFLVGLLFVNYFLYAQVANIDAQKNDFAIRAQNQIRVFLDNIPIIAGSIQPESVIDVCIENVLEVFSDKAIIEEQNKFSKKRRERSPAEYLSVLKTRKESAPILINFEIIDEVAPEKLKEKINPDGSITYIGKMVFRQYYCKLNEDFYKEENMKSSSNSSDCSYSDTTDKKVTFEVKLQKDL